MAQGIGPADIAGRTYSDVIASVQNGLTGDFKHDGALIMSVTAACGGHPQAKEIRRELGRMLHAIAPDDVKAESHRIIDGLESGFDQGLAEARAHIKAGDFGAAKIVLENLIRRFGTGSALYQDDSISEYRHFANDFEAALYVELYRPTRQLRELPQDRATLYALYGAVLIELRDADRAEEALREALRLNPVSTYAMFELGEVMKLSGRKREFRELTLRALQVAYTEAARARAYRNLGYLAIEEADYDLAVACYCMSLGIDPDHARAAQSELTYIQQTTGRTLALPDRETVEAILAKNGFHVGPSQLVTQLMDSPRSESAALSGAPADPGSVVDYTFPSDKSSLRDVTLRTALIDGRLHGRLIGTLTKRCEYSQNEAGGATESHVIDVSTEYIDLETTTSLPHRVAMIPDSEEIREFFAYPMVRRASSDWNDDECVRKPAYEERMRAVAEAERIKAAQRANDPPGVTSYGTPMTPALESLEETAAEDGELAARAIDYAARYGSTRKVRGHAVAKAFYEALNKGGDAWRELAGSLALTARADRWMAVAQQFGPEAAAQTAAPYRETFTRTLEHHLRALGHGGYPIEDPRGPIAPWLMLLAAMERDAKPSLIRRLIGK